MCVSTFTALSHAGFKEIKLIRDGKGKDRLIKLINKDGSEFEVNEIRHGFLNHGVELAQEVVTTDKHVRLNIHGVEHTSQLDGNVARIGTRLLVSIFTATTPVSKR
jgi:hypothetical protein